MLKKALPMSLKDAKNAAAKEKLQQEGLVNFTMRFVPNAEKNARFRLYLPANVLFIAAIVLQK